MTPRLKRLKIENYRSIRGSHAISLDAPVILIHGANGSGKTSLLSAIEMGLTGEAAAMKRADEDYTKHLVHRGAKEASIEMQCFHPELNLGDGKLRIRNGSVEGTPHLPKNVRRFFKERSFLAQATLSRLLEIYQPKAKDSDDALTRFVRELVGLDTFENLLKGVHFTRHKTRRKQTVASYAGALERYDRLTTERKETREELSTFEKDSAASQGRLLSVLEKLEVEEQLDEAAIDAVFEDPSDDAKLVELSSLERELESAIQQWQQISSVLDRGALSKAENQLERAETAMSTWETTYLDSLGILLERLKKLTNDGPEMIDVGFEEAFVFGCDWLNKEHSQLRSKLDDANESRRQLDGARKDEARSRGRLNRLEQQIGRLSSESGALAAALSEIEPFVDGEVCPVCHRDFGETEGSTLHTHLTSHISSLASAAGELREATSARQLETVRLQTARAAIQALERAQLTSEQANEQSTLYSEVHEALTAFQSFEPIMEAGKLHADEVRRCSADLSSLRRQSSTLAGLRSSISAFSERAGVSHQTTSESSEEFLSRCHKGCSESREHLERRLELKRQGREVRRYQLTAKTEENSKRDKLKKLDHEIEIVGRAIKDAEDICEETKALANRAEDIRSDVVRRVFNEKLNDIWRDLFVRLAPDERFVPAFAFHEQKSRGLSVKLETHPREGGVAGHPRSILSAGNLNTAALTLFFSLHLAVEPILPWLIIDDPVQSMDEIHTSQFAALVRTLTRQGARQVAIAVHERPLFEYLALELTPASQDDRLITIELERREGADTVISTETKTWDPDSVYRFQEVASA